MKKRVVEKPEGLSRNRGCFLFWGGPQLLQLSASAALRVRRVRGVRHLAALRAETKNKFERRSGKWTSGRISEAARCGGTTPVTGAVSCGEVPHVTVGAMSAESMMTSGAR